MGSVEVAFFAATEAAVVPVNRSAVLPASSVASVGSRLTSPSANFELDADIAALIEARLFQATAERGDHFGLAAFRRKAEPSDHRFEDCCARATAGHAAGIPRTPRNSRRLMFTPKLSRGAFSEGAFATATLDGRHVRVWVNRVVFGSSSEVRFTPKSDRTADIRKATLSANRVISRRSNMFDHAVSTCRSTRTGSVKKNVEPLPRPIPPKFVRHASR